MFNIYYRFCKKRIIVFWFRNMGLFMECRVVLVIIIYMKYELFFYVFLGRLIFMNISI